MGISLFGAILTRRIALVGAGVVGSSWSLVFARAGFEVAVYDADAASAALSAEFVGTALADMAALGLPSAEPAERIAARVKPTARLEDALDGADYVQESAPERVSFTKMARRSFNLVFGCDGIHSSTRMHWFGAEREFSHFLQAYGSVSIADKLLIRENTSQVYNEPGKAVMISAYNNKTDIILIFFSENENFLRLS